MTGRNIDFQSVCPAGLQPAARTAPEAFGAGRKWHNLMFRAAAQPAIQSVTDPLPRMTMTSATVRPRQRSFTSICAFANSATLALTTL